MCSRSTREFFGGFGSVARGNGRSGGVEGSKIIFGFLLDLEIVPCTARRRRILKSLAELSGMSVDTTIPQTHNSKSGGRFLRANSRHRICRCWHVPPAASGSVNQPARAAIPSVAV